jgi:hypothetical protein
MRSAHDRRMCSVPVGLWGVGLGGRGHRCLRCALQGGSNVTDLWLHATCMIWYMHDRRTRCSPYKRLVGLCCTGDVSASSAVSLMSQTCLDGTWKCRAGQSLCAVHPAGCQQPHWLVAACSFGFMHGCAKQSLCALCPASCQPGMPGM